MENDLDVDPGMFGRIPHLCEVFISLSANVSYMFMRGTNLVYFLNYFQAYLMVSVAALHMIEGRVIDLGCTLPTVHFQLESCVCPGRIRPICFFSAVNSQGSND